MTLFYVPYLGANPAPLLVNGHRLLILSPSEETIEESLDLLGADRVETVTIKRGKVEQSKVVTKLAKQAQAEIVITPPEGAELAEVIRDLSEQLPWVH